MPSATSPPVEYRYDNEIYFRLKAHPAMSFPENLARILLKERFIRTCPMSCTVAHMKKYLFLRSVVDMFTKGDRHSSGNAEQIVRQKMGRISIYIKAKDELIPLNSYGSTDILTIHSKFRSFQLTYPLEFYYYFHEQGSPRVAGHSSPPSPLRISGLSSS